MSTASIIREAAAILILEADKLDGKAPSTAGEVERERIRQALESQQPHEWRDAGPGVPITGVGDNDDSVELDDLLRAFRPFCDALTRERQPDSTGVTFFVPHIKKRGGIGLQSVRLIRDEIRGKWYSAWGEAWRAHPLNANLLPKPEVVEALFSKVYG
jgi:hypothetical protein